eukprot:158778-Pyramimonas_sp.AAC.1
MSGQTRYPSRNFGAEFSRVVPGFAEVEQPLATHKFVRGEQIMSAGRLDRVYINAYTAKLLDCAPDSLIMGSPFDWKEPSDHAPVCLVLRPRGPPAAPKIPSWIARHPEFPVVFAECLEAH